MANELEVFWDSPDGAVCTYGPVVCIVWRSVASVDPVNAAECAVKSLKQRYGNGRKLFYVHRAPDRADPYKSNPAVRNAVFRHFEDHEESFLAAALAIEARGFAGSVMRSVASGVFLVRRTAVRAETFKDTRVGVNWLAQQARDVNPFHGEEMVLALSHAKFLDAPANPNSSSTGAAGLGACTQKAS